MTTQRRDWDWRIRAGCALMACFCAGALADGLLRMKYVRVEPGVRNVATAGAAANEPRISAAAPRGDVTRTAADRAAVPRVAATTGVVPAEEYEVQRQAHHVHSPSTGSTTTAAISSGATSCTRIWCSSTSRHSAEQLSGRNPTGQR